jgi:hypothetical protein
MEQLLEIRLITGDMEPRNPMTISKTGAPGELPGAKIDGSEANEAAGNVGIQTAEATPSEVTTAPGPEPSPEPGGMPAAYRAVFACVSGSETPTENDAKS